MDEAPANRLWDCSYVAHVNDSDGLVSFTLRYADAAGNIGETKTQVTDGTSVVADKTKPNITAVSLVSSSSLSFSLPPP